MRRTTATDRLTRLVRIRDNFGPDPATEKLELLRRLTRARLPSHSHVSRLHEQLCFMRAYPDSAEILDLVESMLVSFSARFDLKRFRGDLVNTGISGAELDFHFYWLTATWLVLRWPERLEIDWPKFQNDEALTAVLSLLRTYSESGAMVEMQLPAREWLDHMRPSDETGATFLVRRIQRLSCSEEQRTHLFESLRLPLRLAPGPRPSRTLAKWAGAKISFQTDAWVTARPQLRQVIPAEPRSVRSVSRALGTAFIEQAREAMIARNRDLDAIAWASPDDVQLIDWGDGLQFAWLGICPEHRPMFEGLYVYITLKNGVPIGYVQAAALFSSAFINFNVFPPWRGGEAAAIYGKALATARHMLGLDVFGIDVYQLGGDGNQEALETGAWWFYYKLGFRPRSSYVKGILRDEQRRIQRHPGHRSTSATLEELASDEVFLHLGKQRADIIGRIDFGAVGLAIMSYVANRFGSEREAGLRECAEDARKRLGLRSTQLDALDRNHKRAWERWSPLIMLLPGVDRWSSKDKRALFEVVCAKGGKREADFVRLFDAHEKLRHAFLQLASRRPHAQ